MSFSDVRDHWAKDCIQQLFDRSIVRGYPDGSFRPENLLTRAEFAAILSKTFPETVPIREAIEFRDIPTTHWAFSAIQRLSGAGFFSGFPDGTFRPNLPIPRVQVFVALASGLRYGSHPNPVEILSRYFDDAAAIPRYAKGTVAAATEQRLIVNYPDVRRLKPNNNASRADIAALICRALNLPGVPIESIPGVVAIAPQFEEADSFADGLARVKAGEKWGYIDTTGKWVIRPMLDEAEPFSEGVALVRSYSLRQLEVPAEIPPTEIRGVWLTTTGSQVFDSRENIAKAMDFLVATGFNSVFPVVWNNAATLYPSATMRELFGREINLRFVGRDPLRELVTEAKRVGLAVIPWFEYGFASSYNQQGGLLISRKPEWGGKDAKGNLLVKSNFDWMNALDSDVQNFISSLILEVVKNYDVAGIQGDDRCPAMPSEGGYDAKTVALYRQQFDRDPPSNSKDAQWVQWRADRLTDFLTRLYRELIAVNPNLIISLSPSPYPWGLVEYLQDNQTWMDRGLIDLIHPQLYRRDFQSYKSLVDDLLKQITPQQVPFSFPGILIKSGSYRISTEHLLQAIQYNRDRGFAGEVLFFYEGLREDNDALAKALRSGPYAHYAPFSVRDIKARGFTPQRVKGLYYYIDSQGQRFSQPQFDRAGFYQEDRSPVKLGYKWGYIDKLGQLVTRLEYDEADGFSQGLARVKIGKKYGYIDRNGGRVVSPQFDDAGAFQAIPQSPQTPIPIPTSETPTPNSEPPIPPPPLPILPTALAPVKTGNSWGYIAPNGQLLISSQFEFAAPFSDGFARIRVARKYGYINAMGQSIVPGNFDDAGDFSEGLAAIQVNLKWGYIDKTGKTIISPQFDETQAFSEGLAAVRVNTLWGYIDRTGVWFIHPKFEEASPVLEGLAQVKANNQWGYIRGLNSRS
ncbi:MAG: WG repeat-containing protein [Geitlerinemataceae cyanobacterium]